MGEIHSVAARGFGAAAETYAAARPEYPPAAVDAVVEAMALPAGHRVLELGAGTGTFTRALLERGVTVAALEPVRQMRAILAGRSPGVEIMEGSAESIGSPGEAFDAAVAAQAFHWFRFDEAVPEIARVLKPGGTLALVWNVRDERPAWVREITEIIEPYEEPGGVRVPRHRERRWREALEQRREFAPVSETEFGHPGQEMDLEGLVARVGSTSFIAELPAQDRATVDARVRALAERHAELRAARFTFPYVTEVYVYRRA
ncbi:MAG TPA: class I SAM-dependent methyltransferase [Actinomycetota bacterium]